MVYSYRQSDPEALGNFQYFLDNVLSPRDPARYIVVVDHNSPQQRGHMSLAGLPRLPTNAQYLSIRDCYELGHVGKVLLGLKSKHVSTEKYDYFVWLDSSVKRSVFPTADAQGKHAAPWHTQLTARISSTTKLIGASISCEAATPQQTGDHLVPHVEAVIMATDKVGLAVLQQAKCFDCYSTWHEAKMKGEIAASSAILKANYNLDAFLPPYQNVNWQDKRSWPCATTHRPQQHQDPGSKAGLLTNIVESFRTGSKATAADISSLNARSSGEEHPAERGTAGNDPDFVVQDELVEELLEAEEKLDEGQETHHLPRAAHSNVLQIEVSCDELEQEPAERQEEEMQEAAADLASQVAHADAAQGVDLVFYGDSILDMLVAESGELTNVFQDVFGDYSATVQAVGGDQTAHLWWRVLHGAVFERQQPKLSIILIGGNDLEAAAECGEGSAVMAAAVPQMVSRVETIIRHLRLVNPDTPVLLLSLTALKADDDEPNAEGAYPWPNKYTPALVAYNEELERVAIREDNVHYQDCLGVLLSDDGIPEAMMPDGIHPSSHGMNLLAQCIAPAVHRLTERPGK